VEVEALGCDGAITAPSGDPEGDAGTELNRVEALSERWGVVRANGGPTRVWAQLACADQVGERASAVATEP
jgi:hypothetical protein